MTTSAYKRISQTELASLREVLQPLIGTQFKSLSLPLAAMVAFEPSQIGTIVGSLMDALIPHLTDIPQVGLHKHAGILGEREGYPDYQHESGARAELIWGSHIPAQHFRVIDGFEFAPVAYTSDVPLLTQWGVPLLFGPGSIHVAHTPNEYIDTDELDASVSAYQRIVRALLS